MMNLPGAKKHSRKKGFSLTEMMIVVAIIAILCAIAIPSIISLRNSLRFKQHNDYAKSIFMAAQSHLTDMRSDGRLDEVPSTTDMCVGLPEGKDWTDDYRVTYHLSGSTDSLTYAAVLPVGTVDATVRDGNVIIEYNPDNGNVYAVFYSEKESGLWSLYSNGSINREDSDAGSKDRKKQMIGYYCGSGLTEDALALQESTTQVEFINGQEGMVKVSVSLPEGFSNKFNDFYRNLLVDLEITGQTPVGEGASAAPRVITLDNLSCEWNLSVDALSVYTLIPIDSLKDQKSFASIQPNTSGKYISEIGNESLFSILPGDNVDIVASVEYNNGVGLPVDIQPGFLSNVNPMFETLVNGTLTIANGRNLQNLNLLSPTIAKTVKNVVFTADIDWSETVNYYNAKNNTEENPGRSLPYFVPIHNEALFGTAQFIYYENGSSGGGFFKELWEALQKLGSYVPNENVPTLTDEIDNATNRTHATIEGGGHKVYNLNIDATKYTAPAGNRYYVCDEYQVMDYQFTGLFGYVNTPVSNLFVVNPIVKGNRFETAINNPATGALIGAAGFNTVVTNCGVYIDTDYRTFDRTRMGQEAYSATANQNWYGVSGEGAVGGLVGYAKSHRTLKSNELANDEAHLAFSRCFAAVNVSGNMRGNTAKHFGYSNGVGGLIGNSQLTNFYNCYASGDVMANNAYVGDTLSGGIWNLINIFGIKLELPYNGRTSYGAGGFVGSSHGTRYTRCFATGDVAGYSGSNLGIGGFVGLMSIDETFCYGHISDNATDENIAQRTIFTECYSVGMSTSNGNIIENFSGANARVIPSFGQTASYITGDYYRLYAPHYHHNKGAAPDYEDVYIYRDTYYLSNYHSSFNPENSNNCAEPETYDTLTDIPGSHRDKKWVEDHVNAIKSIALFRADLGIIDISYTYKQAYFDKHNDLTDNLTDIYLGLYRENYQSGWVPATAATTHPYTIVTPGAVYPFSKLDGMDYYGDWPSYPSSVGLAYYERYTDDKDTKYVSIFFDREKTSKLKNDVDSIVKEDGYVVLSASGSVSVTIGTATKNLTKTGQTFTVGSKKYNVFRLTTDLVNAAIAEAKNLPEGKFYVEVKVNDGENKYTMYFNPFVAVSQVNPANGNETATRPMTADHRDIVPNQVRIRSARQLASLQYVDSYFTEDVKYVQQLNIDATKYDWGEGVKVPTFSIGTDEKPFNATYTGHGAFGETRPYITGFDTGLFGIVGKEGKISFLTLNLSGVAKVESKTASAGFLACESYGTIADIQVNAAKDGDKATLTLSASGSGEKNMGGVIGLNTGSVTNVTLSAKDMTLSTGTAANAGGLIGKSAGAVTAVDGKETMVNAVVSGCSVELGGLTANAANAGGFIGLAKDTDITFSETTKDAPPAVVLGGLNNTLTTGTSGGVIGTLNTGSVQYLNVKLTGDIKGGNTLGGAIGSATSADLKAVLVQGENANLTATNVAGMICTSGKVSVANGDVRYTGGAMTGTEFAAGVIGNVDKDSSLTVKTALENITINGGKNAAGFTITNEGKITEGDLKLSTGENTTTVIKGTENAAGFAITTGSVSSFGVRGHGTISGGQAAGFAVTLKSDAELNGCQVTPAPADTAYKGDSNSNLTITGAQRTAGFVLDNNGTITNCWALGKLFGTGAAGFVHTNKGPISKSMANVAFSGSGYAFTATNTGTVANCYGWYDGTGVTIAEIGSAAPAPTETQASEESSTAGVAPAAAAATANCTSCYFGNIAGIELGEDLWNRADASDITITLHVINSKGAYSQMKAGTPEEIQAILKALNGNQTVWDLNYPANAYTLTGAYPYPCIRTHFGDWATAPDFFSGVLYYEEYSDNTYGVYMVDLTDPDKVDVKGKVDENGVALNSKPLTGVKEITSAGYLLYGRDNTKFDSGESGYCGAPVTDNAAAKALKGNVVPAFYNFYQLKPQGQQSIALTDSRIARDQGIIVNPLFANGLYTAEPTEYELRTPGQFANMHLATGVTTFNQTNNIVAGNFTTVPTVTAYDGTGMALTLDMSKAQANSAATAAETTETAAPAASGTWISNLVGTMSLNSLTLKSATGTVIENATGNISIGTLTVEGDLSGTVIGNTSADVKIDNLTVQGSISGSVIGSSTGAVTLNGKLTVSGTVSGTVIADAGNVNLKNVEVNGIASGASVVGKSRGDVAIASVTVRSTLAGSVVNTVSGNTAINSASILTGESDTAPVTGSLVASADGNVTVSAITVGTPLQSSLVASVKGDTTIASVTLASTASSGSVVGTSSGSATTITTVTVNNGHAGTIVKTAGSGTVTLTTVTISGEKTTTSAPTDPSNSTDDTQGETQAPTVAYGDVPGSLVGTGKTVTLGSVSVTGNLTGTLVNKASAVTTGTVTIDGKITGANAALVNDATNGAVNLNGVITAQAIDEATLVKKGGNVTVSANGGINISTVTGSLVENAADVTISPAVTLDSLNGHAVKSATTVSITSLTVKGQITKPIIGTLNGTVTNTSVTVENAVLTTSGLLIGDFQGSGISGCTVSANSVQTSAPTFGIIVGDLGSGKSITGTKVSVGTLTLTGTDSQTVGAMVGKVSGGAITGGTITGLSGQTTVPASITVAENASAQNNIVGGVVGEVSGGSVTNVTSEVKVSDRFEGSTLVNPNPVSYFGDVGKQAVNPSGQGPVGLFVGYVSGGSITDCYAKAPGNETYHFLGEIAASTANTNTTMVVKESDVGEDLTVEFNPNPSETILQPDADTAYRTFDAALNDCRFDLNGATKIQTTDEANRHFYFKAGEPVVLTNYTIGASIKGGFNPVTVNEFKSNASVPDNEVNGQATNYYYSANGENYYRLYVNVTVTGRWNKTYTATFYYGETEKTVAKRIKSDWYTYWEQSPSEGTIHQLKPVTSSAFDTENKTYIIVDAGGNIVVPNDQSTSTIKPVTVVTGAQFTTSENILWKFNGNTFQPVSDGSKYLSNGMGLTEGANTSISLAYTVSGDPITTPFAAAFTFGTGNTYYVYECTADDSYTKQAFTRAEAYNHICWYIDATTPAPAADVAVSGQEETNP